MSDQLNLLLTAAPDRAAAAMHHGLPIAHHAYRIGRGAHLYRAAMPLSIRGGLMALDDNGFSDSGSPDTLCRECMRECANRGFTGVLCLFNGPVTSFLGDTVHLLSTLTARRGWPLYVPEAYADCAPESLVLVSSALSGGTLRQRLLDAIRQYGEQRTVLAVERTAADFFLPAPDGQGAPLSRKALQDLMDSLSPTVFFSDELCAHYFTYMSRESGAHFILFDNAGSIRKKLLLARTLGIRHAAMAYSQVDDLLDSILADS